MRVVGVLCLVLLFSSALPAQWEVDLSVQPYPPPYVSQWENQTGIVTLQISNNGSTVETVRVYLSIESDAHGTIINAVSDPIVFEAGETRSTDNTEMADWSGWGEFNEDLREQIVRSGRIPEDHYEICVDVKKVSSGELYGHQCASFDIVAPSPPSLVSPSDGDTLDDPHPTFSWTSLSVPPGYEVTYHLKICEVLEGQTKEQAIEGYPLHEADLVNQTSYPYPVDAPELDSGKTYAWQVQARDPDGNPLGENEGKSEIWAFTYGVAVPPEGGEFEIDSIKIILPDTLFVGQLISSKLVLWARPGTSGHVVGAIYIDGTHWMDFGEDVSDTDTIVSLPLPTDSGKVGSHWLKYYIEEPSERVDSVKYCVKMTEQLIPGLDSLIVVPDLIYLKNITGTVSSPTAGRYVMSGSGLLRIKPFDDETLRVDIDSLDITLNPSHPESSTINSGKILKESEDSALFKLYKDALHVTKVYYEGPSDQIFIDAQVYIPYAGSSPITTLNDIMVTSNGIEGKAFSTNQQFTMFGFTFKIHDVSPHKAIELGYDRSEDFFWTSFSGSIQLRMHGRDTTLLSYSGFRFEFSDEDFNIRGTFALPDPLRFIPGNDYVLLDTFSFYKEEDWYLLLKGKVNLPSPLDTLGPIAFSLKTDFDGNMVGGVNIIGPESPGLGGGDVTEFDLWIVTFDLRYVGLRLMLQDGELVDDQCEVGIIADLYFPIVGDTSKTRVSLGKTIGDSVLPGITVDFDGNVDWKAEYLGDIEILHDKKIDLKVLYMDFASLAILSNPFEFHISGTFGLNFRYVEGGVEFTNLRIDKHGNFVNISQATTGGNFEIYRFVSIELDTLAFGEDTTLTYARNASTITAMRQGNGQVDTVTVEVDNFFLMTGAHITLGTDLASGGFDKLLVYKKKDGGKKFYIDGANLNIAGVQLLSNFVYSNPSLRIAGSVTLPNGTGGIVVGKVGQNEAGEPSFGLFLAAQELHIQVYASVFLNDLGGGFFYNPDAADIDAVREMCGFNREKMGTIDEKKPEPGAFGILLYAGLYVANENLVEGRALMSLTENCWSLDAEILALEDRFVGDFYLDISWSPAFLQGEFNVNVNFYQIIEGRGGGAFYVYSSDVWGIQMSGNIVVLPSISFVTLGTDFFLGPPGFLLETTFHKGINLYVLSGGIDFDMMFWWQKNISWGAYAKLHASAEILGGLVGVSGGLEGAFIGAPEYVVYCVGEFSAECCWVEVFSGSIWISIGADGLDGGTGRNSRYDQIIEDAKHLADKMEEDMDSLQQALDDAFNSLLTLSEEQVGRMGQNLVNALTVNHYSLRWNFFHNMYSADKRMGAPNPMLDNVFNQVLFNPANRSIGAGRDTLEMLAEELRSLMDDIDARRNAVKEKLARYHNILEGELPTVRELALGNPVGSPQYSTVTVGGNTITVQTGFGFDESRAESNGENIAGVKEDLEAYKNALEGMVLKFTANIDTIERILYSQPNPVFELSEAYAGAYEKFARYFSKFLDYLEFVQQQSASVRSHLSRHENDILNAVHEQTERLYPSGIPGAPLSHIRNLVSYREQIMHELDSTFPLHHYLDMFRRSNPSDSVAFWKSACDSTGFQVWYRIPYAGFTYLINRTVATRDTVKQTFSDSRNEFVTKWIRYTFDLSAVFERESRLYELLYDLYDQLSLLTTEGRMVYVYHPGIGPFGGIFIPTYYTAEQMREHHAEVRDSIADFLRAPLVTYLSGYSRSANVDYAKIHLNYSADHPEGIVEYSYCPVAPSSDSGGGFFPPLILLLYRSLGLRTSTDIPLIRGVDPEGLYTVYLRARGRGGYTITRTGEVQVAYMEAGGGVVNFNLSSVDSTPPTIPIVEDDGDFTSSSDLLHVRWRAFDPQSGINEYLYSVGTMVYFPMLHTNVYMPNVKDWTSAGGMTELNIRGLNLQNGSTYYVGVKAVNGEGMQSPMGLSDGITVDTTPPTVPDINQFVRTYYGGPQTLFLRWAASVDSQSTIARYEYALGKTPYGNELKDWTRVSPILKRVYIHDIAMREGDTIYAQVRAINGAGLASFPDTASMVVHFYDNSPPAPPEVNLTYSFARGLLRITWSPSSDPQSGIYEYRYRVFKWSGSHHRWEPMGAWKSAGRNTSATVSMGRKRWRIKVIVKAINGAGLESQGEKTLNL